MAAFGTVIAERRLVDRDSPRRRVTVSIGCPRPDPVGGGDWECPFRITGAGLRRLEYGRGVDAMQAMITAFDFIRVLLAETGLPLVFPNRHGVDTGFPYSIPNAFGPAFTTRLERMVEREMARELKRLESRHAKRQAARKRTATRSR